MNFPRENSYLTFSGSRWIQPGLRTRKRHLHALKSLFIARAREKPGPPRFFQTDPAPLPPPPLAQWPTVSKGILNWEKKKKKHEGFKRPRRRAFHWGDIEFSRVWRGGGSSEYYDPSKFSARFTCDWLRGCNGSWTGVVNNNLWYS